MKIVTSFILTTFLLSNTLAALTPQEIRRFTEICHQDPINTLLTPELLSPAIPLETISKEEFIIAINIFINRFNACLQERPAPMGILIQVPVIMRIVEQIKKEFGNRHTSKDTSLFDLQMVDSASDITIKPSWYSIHILRQLKPKPHSIAQVLKDTHTSRANQLIRLITQFSSNEGVMPSPDTLTEITPAYAQRQVKKNAKYEMDYIEDPLTRLPVANLRTFTQALKYWSERGQEITLNQLPDQYNDPISYDALYLHTSDAVMFLLHFTKHPYGLFKKLASTMQSKLTTNVQVQLASLKRHQHNNQDYYLLHDLSTLVEKSLTAELD